jgi:hypothetical protein
MTEPEIVSAEAEIISAPEAWPVIPGGGGIRKARVARGGKGKSGGARVTYFWMSMRGELYFLTAYAKNVQKICRETSCANGAISSGQSRMDEEEDVASHHTREGVLETQDRSRGLVGVA